MAGTRISPGPCEKPPRHSLEAEAEAELALERNADGLGEAGRPEEVDRLLEVRAADRAIERVAKVRRVEDVEAFDKERQLHVLGELVAPPHPQVDLRELVAALGERRQVVLVVAVSRLAVVDDAVAVDVAAGARARVGKDAVRPRRGELHDGRELEAPR